MPSTKIQVTFDAEKLAAIRQFAPDEAASIPAELAAVLEKMYRKSVPAAVRVFIDGHTKPEDGAGLSDNPHNSVLGRRG